MMCVLYVSLSRVSSVIATCNKSMIAYFGEEARKKVDKQESAHRSRSARGPVVYDE